MILIADSNSFFTYLASVGINISGCHQSISSEHLFSYTLRKSEQALMLSIRPSLIQILKTQKLLQRQQQNLTEKFSDKPIGADGLQERKAQSFFHHLPPQRQQELLQELKYDYRQILLNYFTADKQIKTKIDRFTDKVFLTNLSVPQIVEIHVALIDEFSKQLKLEGRSDELLLDYRLTLIDVLAHLCELYRRSMTIQS